MKSRFLILTAVLLSISLCVPCTVSIAGNAPATYALLLSDMAASWLTGTGPEKIRADAAAINDGVAAAIAEHWEKVWLDPDYRLFLYGTDDPSALPVTGKHAFVVLGFRLQNGEMTDELKGRCDAAAAAAKAFPDSILICTGGATGKNNPGRHTEAGLMKAYLTDICGIAPERILTDEKAMNTLENTLNTFDILEEQGVDSLTIVTSAYHQRRAQALYSAAAARYRQVHGRSAEIIGNFCFETQTNPDSAKEMATAILQMAVILKAPLRLS